VNILVVCDYKINPDRIGGMDRFFKLFDESVKSDGHQITWVFADVIRHSFYKDVTMFSTEKNGVLQFTEDYLKNSSTKVDVLITHFVTQYSPYFKRFKKIHQIKKIFCVDHNPRPLDGFPLKKRIKKRIKGFLYYSYIDKVIGVSEYTSKHSIKDFGTLTAKKLKLFITVLILLFLKTKRVEIKQDLLLILL
jgi:hypothetical protein